MICDHALHFHNIVVAVMLMETFDRVTHKEKYVWDVSKMICLIGIY
jgi:hypothetical protein